MAEGARAPRKSAGSLMAGPCLVWDNVVSLERARRRHAGAMRSDSTATDPPMVARVLCRYLATVGGSRWVRLDAVAEQTKITQEKLIVGAAYAHMRGWAEAQWEAGRPLASIYLARLDDHAVAAARDCVSSSVGRSIRAKIRV